MSGKEQVDDWRLEEIFDNLQQVTALAHKLASDLRDCRERAREQADRIVELGLELSIQKIERRGDRVYWEHKYNAPCEAADGYHEALSAYFNAPTEADIEDARRVLYRLYKVEMYARTHKDTKSGGGKPDLESLPTRDERKRAKSCIADQSAPSSDLAPGQIECPLCCCATANESFTAPEGEFIACSSCCKTFPAPVDKGVDE